MVRLILEIPKEVVPLTGSAEEDLPRALKKLLALELVRQGALTYGKAAELLDIVRGRRIAKRLGLSVKGTIGILTRARREGLIPNVKDEMDRLRQQGTWIHPDLYRDVLQMVGEML